MKFVQHIPGFVSGFDPIEIEGDWKDILKHEVIQKCMSDDFHKWSWSPNADLRFKALLMLESKQGKSWRVIGYLDEVPALIDMWTGGVK